MNVIIIYECNVTVTQIILVSIAASVAKHLICIADFSRLRLYGGIRHAVEKPVYTLYVETFYFPFSARFEVVRL